MLAATFVAAAALASPALAHGGVLSYSWGGQWYKGFSPYNSAAGQVTIQRPWMTYNPLQDATASTLACNDDGTDLGSSQLSASVTAGTAITAYWNNPWPHAIGPQLTYLAQCPGSSCNGVNAASLEWFKIDEAGLLSGTAGAGSWAAGKMIANNNTWTTTIPTSVPSGAYLIRFETIALHSLPAQMYPECAQINIVGGGSRAPTASELCKFPGCYSNSDPGLTIDIYGSAAQTQTTYQIPGPPLYGGAGGSSPQPAPSSTKPAPTSTAKPTSTTKPTTTAVPTTTKGATTAPAPTTTASGTVARYGQCGGTGYNGPTVCASGSTCTASNQYYSQCL